MPIHHVNLPTFVYAISVLSVGSWSDRDAVVFNRLVFTVRLELTCHLGSDDIRKFSKRLVPLQMGFSPHFEAILP